MATDIRAAVVIAHYGSKNTKYLDQVLSAWETMPHVKAAVTVLTEKALAAGAAPASLPFLARTVLADKLVDGEEYDLFIFSEDDILIREANLKTWSALTLDTLRIGEIAGFLRYELNPKGEKSFPDMHGGFRWQNLEKRRGETFAEFSNCVAACYVFTRWQLRWAIESGGFLVPPHSDPVYGTLERGSADPYLQCGLRRLLCLSRFEDLLVHHLPNNYLHLGKSEAAVRAELKAMDVEWKGKVLGWP